VILAIFAGRRARRWGNVEPVPTDALDNVPWAALTGPQARFAEVHGRAARFDPEVSPFVALADTADPAAWADLVELVGAGQDLFVAGPRLVAPPGWERVGGLSGVQMVDGAVPAEADPEAVVLGPSDVPEILDLVDRTKPGPFRKRTIELGTYLGIRREGTLIAMAGERLRVPGWTEISAVCTDPAFRGQGLAARLIKAVTAEVRARGDRPFLHAAAENQGAIRLYEKLGFVLRTPVMFGVWRETDRVRESGDGSAAER
jgi:ribosomal protein S18 acetylase RimI-like enzyme